MKKLILLSIVLIVSSCTANSENPAPEDPVAANPENPSDGTPENPADNTAETTDQNEEVVFKIIRPGDTDVDYFPVDVENIEMMFEVHHPDGVKQIRLVGIDAKNEAENWTDDFNPQSGYFYFERRFKGGALRDYRIEMETENGEFIVSEKIFYIDNFAHEPGNVQMGIIPTYQGYINLKDGDEVQAGTPLYIGVDSMDPDGGFLVEDNEHGLDDLNGILWVKLKIDGVVVETKTNSSELPLTPESETSARSFGLYEFFNIVLSEGVHTVQIESSDREGNINQCAPITITAVSQ
ncbi:hypothetical protein [Gaetbulibacter aestuarii]|uniref:Uncharacterized protein n=1 Tax=Gaetbulibacter aestuarii TaxID=1502358 RepID=A0ABW7MZ41_9FLAO